MRGDRGFSLRAYVDKKRSGYVLCESILARHPEVLPTQLKEEVVALMDEGRLEPVKAARVMYRGTPPLMTKYRIVVDPSDTLDTSGLNPRIADSSWVASHPDRAKDVESFLRQLSLALDGTLDCAGLDKREAGYVLALDEHAFDESTAYTRALSSLKIDLAEIGVTDAPYPPTMETYPGRKAIVVVSENVGPYNRLRRIARDQDLAATAFGFAPAAVVFGNGRFATNPNFVPDILDQAGLEKGARLLYWGDLDREGVRILTSVCADPSVRAEAWAGPYHAMLDAARRRAPRDSADERSIPTDPTILEASLSPSDLALAKRLLARGAIVPQEAVSPEAYADGSFSCQ